VAPFPLPRVIFGGVGNIGEFWGTVKAVEGGAARESLEL
jgi:hypothetical protein